MSSELGGTTGQEKRVNEGHICELQISWVRRLSILMDPLGPSAGSVRSVWIWLGPRVPDTPLMTVVKKLIIVARCNHTCHNCFKLQPNVALQKITSCPPHQLPNLTLIFECLSWVHSSH